MGSTFFFRDTHILEHIAIRLLPEISGRTITKIWDAGCAHGPEPYTLAMILAENLEDSVFQNLTIDATDYDPGDQFGTIIKDGIYTREELERIPPHILEKYFERWTETDGRHRVREFLRNRIRYRKHDLLTLQPIGGGYSLIICKNVLLHFHQEQRVQVIKMFHSSLAPGGLFACEQTQKMPVEIAHLFQQLVPDAQLFKKIG